MVNNIYSIQLNSTKGTATNILGSSGNNSLTYLFDWSVLPDNRTYKFSFAYIGCANNLQGKNLCNVEVDIGQCNTYTTDSSRCGAQVYKTVGNLYPYNVNASNSFSYLYAERNFNPSIYLPCKPNNTQITVNIKNQSGGFWLDDATTPVPNGNYILTLIFEEI